MRYFFPHWLLPATARGPDDQNVGEPDSDDTDHLDRVLTTVLPYFSNAERVEFMEPRRPLSTLILLSTFFGVS
jgi:hypothetical protein